MHRHLQSELRDASLGHSERQTVSDIIINDEQ